jgi:hypothetical protein
MAQPNIVNVSTIRGNTAVANVTNVTTAIVSNPAASGSVYKVNAIYVSNIDSANLANVDISVFRSGYDYYLANTISIPIQSTLDILSKAIYLEEQDSLRVSASTNNHLQVVCSYEDIS